MSNKSKSPLYKSEVKNHNLEFIRAGEVDHS